MMEKGVKHRNLNHMIQTFTSQNNNDDETI